MKSVLSQIVGASALLAGVASAQQFRFVTELIGSVNRQRVWYGDGNLYVGPRVPAEIEVAANFTAANWHEHVPEVPIVSLPPAEPFPEGYVLAINRNEGATDPAIFTSEPESLPEGWVSTFNRWGLFVVPPGTTISSWYLEPTSEPATFILTWRTPGTISDAFVNVNLTAVS